MAVSVDHYRIRNDDGTQATATWKALEDVSATVQNAITFRVRVSYSEPGANPTYVNQWEANKNGGAFADVTTVSANVKAVNSVNVTDGTATTSQLTNALTFVAGEITTDGLCPAKALVGNSTQDELVCQTVGAAIGDVFIIRPKTVTTFLVQPTVTVGSGATKLLPLLGVG